MRKIAKNRLSIAYARERTRFGCFAMCFVVPVLALWSERNLEYLAFLIKDQVVDIPYWLVLILTLFTWPWHIVGNLCVEILRYLI